MDNKNLHCRPVVPMPEWLRLMAPKGRVGKLDFAKLLGYKGAQSLDVAIANGEAPRPDVATHSERAQGIFTPAGKRCWWSKKAVVAEYQRRLNYFAEKA